MNRSTRFYSSDLARARDTAEIIAERLSLEFGSTHACGSAASARGRD